MILTGVAVAWLSAFVERYKPVKREAAAGSHCFYAATLRFVSPMRIKSTDPVIVQTCPAYVIVPQKEMPGDINVLHCARGLCN